MRASSTMLSSLIPLAAGSVSKIFRSRAISSTSIKFAAENSPIPSHVPDTTRYLGMPGAVFIKVAEDACPFIRDTITCKVTRLEPGKMTMSMPYKPAFIGNPVSKVLHGGVAAALIDHVGGFAAMSSIQDKSMLLATVDLRIDYLCPAPPEMIHCDAEVISTKKTLVRADIIAWNADRTQKIAIGRALYSMYPTTITLNDTM